MNEIKEYTTKLFEDIKHIDEQDNEYWLARELKNVLGYNQWRSINDLIERENDILDKYNLSDIDVLKVGHHGSNTSSSENFIKNISPKYSLISVGENNRYGHPKDSVLNILRNSKIYRTDIEGSIMFKIKNNKLKIETCSP